MKKAFSILLVAIMLFSTLAIGTQAQTITTESTQDKLTDELKAHLATVEDDEYVPIYIWLNEQDEEMVYAVLSKTLGMTVTKNSEEAYIERKASAKAELLSKGLENLAKTPEYSLQARATGTIDIVNLTPDVFRAQANIPEIMTNDEIKNCIESGMTSDVIINLSERTQFLSDFRMARKSLNNATNEQFYKLLNLDKCKNVYLDPLLAYVRMDCKKSYIDNLENMDVVREIGHHIETQFSIDNGFDSEENETYCAHHMLQDNYNLSNSGAGVKIGVIEAVYDSNNIPSRYYDTLNPHLLGKQINFRASSSEQSTYAISTHATKVLSILCGNPIASNTGEIYQGIVPNATVFLANIVGESEINDAMEWLVITNNAHIITYSGGVNDGGQYSSYSRKVDNVITQYRVVFVNSAGNEYNAVSNPGLAYNAITVGNCAKRKSDNVYERTVGASSFDEVNNVTNKPDIMAEGTNIYMIKSSEMIAECLGTGTSFSAPQVTATAALVLCSNSRLIGKPDTVKAIILGSANETIISGQSDSIFITYHPIGDDLNQSPWIENPSAVIRDRAGAGLLNIFAAKEMANLPLYYEYDLVLEETPVYVTTGQYYMNANEIIKIGLVYENITRVVPMGYDLNLQVLCSNGEIILEANSVYNNVEMLVFKVKQSGFYSFRIKATKSTNTAVSTTGTIDATLFLTCGKCQERDITVSYSKSDTSIDCSCGFHCEEVHELVNRTIFIPNAFAIRFEAYYSVVRNCNNDDFDYYYYSPVISLSNYTNFVDLRVKSYEASMTGNVQTITYEYEIYMEQTINGSPYGQTIQLGTVVIVQDFSNKTVTIS